MTRLERVLEGLKAEFYAAGKEYQETQDKALLDELNALTSAINALEDFMYDRRITVITDCLEASEVKRPWY